MEIQIDLGEKLSFPCTMTPENATVSAGGSAVNQMIAAARCGAKTSIVGSIGEDIFAQHILETLRREGINTAGIAKRKTQTSVINSIIDNEGQKASVIFEGANIDSTAEQIPDSSLNEKNLILLQNDIKTISNINILKRAKNCGAITIMSLNHANNIETSMFEDVDITIINEHAFENICNKIHLSGKNRAKSLATETKTHIIIAKDHGLLGTNATNINGDNNSYTKGFDGNEIIDKSGSFDAFCGCFAACIQAGVNLDRSMKYARAAANLTAMKYGTYNAFPYLSDIEEIID